MNLKRLCIFLTLMFLASTSAQAQNTSAVFSPDVSAGESAFEYRAACDPGVDGFAHRFHYQYAF